MAGLNHVTGDSNQLMFPTVDPRAIKAIGDDDRYGIRYLYEAAYTATHPDNTDEWERFTGPYTYDNYHRASGYKGADWTGGSPFPLAYNTTQNWSNRTGATSWLAFRGSRITWVFAKCNNRGSHEIYIDGNYRETINTYDTNILWQVHKTWELAQGDHIIEVRGLGGGATYTDLDAFAVDINRATGTHDDTSSSIKFLGNWTHDSGWPGFPTSGPYNTTHSFSNTTNDAIVFTFQGSQVRYYFAKALNRGYAKVTIDGELKQNIDMYSPVSLWNQSVTYNLPNGTHTIHVAVQGAKNPASNNFYIDVDRFVVQ